MLQTLDFKQVGTAMGASAESMDFLESSLASVLQRSQTDEVFREQLKTDPWTAFSGHLGLTGASADEVGFNLEFIESQGPTTVVLPPVAVVEMAELSEDELEAVAGGITPTVAAGLACAAAVATCVRLGVSCYNLYKAITS